MTAKSEPRSNFKILNLFRCPYLSVYREITWEYPDLTLED